MSPETWATFSNQAFAAAAVVLALSWLAHLLEFAAGRTVPAHDREAALVGAGATAAGEEHAPSVRVELFGRVGLSLSILGTAVLAAGALSRGLAAERVPWGNMFEFATTGAAIAMVVYLILVRLYSVQWLGAVVAGFAVIVLGLSMLVYVDAGPLVPALDSYWLVLHVAAAMIAGAAFVVGAGASAFYLLKARAERIPGGGRSGYLSRLPSAASMDRLAYRVHAFAFPLWTFAALIAGPIWAEHAWGRYWGWDPKEVWAFITWVVYAGYLHARATAGWRGKGAAVLALIGFTTFIFNFVGINLFGSGLHAYSF